MTTLEWRTDEGWPYPDEDLGPVDLASEMDEDAVAIHVNPKHLLDGLDALERTVIAGRYGLGGPVKSIKQLRDETGHTHAELRDALGTGLAKMRRHFL